MSDNPEVAPPETEAKPAPAGKKRLLPVLVLAGGLVLGLGGGLFAIGPSLAGKSSHPTDSTAAAEGGDAHGAAAGDDAKGRPVQMIDNVVLNPAGSNGTRFLIMAAAVEMSDAAAAEELKGRDAEARDILLRVLGAKTVEQLTSLAARDSMRVELATAIGAMFSRPNAVRRIYFPQFVVQ